VSTEEQWSEIRQRRRLEFTRLPPEQQERLIDAYEDFFVSSFGASDEAEALFTGIRGHARRPEHGPAGHMGMVARRRAYERESQQRDGASAG
jgi:hypothetical protein